MNDKWINDIRQKMTGHEVKAPDGLLDDVKAEMRRRGLTVQTPSRRPVWQPLLRYSVTAAAAVALLLWIVLPANETIEPAEHSVAATQPTTNQPANELQLAKDDVSMNTQSGLVGSGLARVARAVSAFLAPETTTELVAQVINDESAEHSLAEPETQTTTKNAEENKRKPLPQTYVPESPQSYYDTHRPRHTAVRGAKGAFLAGAFWGGGVPSGGQTGFGMATASDMPISYDYQNFQFVDTTGMPVRSQHSTIKAKHRHPFKVGLSLRYRLGSRLSVQSGLNYSYLQSDLTHVNGVSETTERQRLHYLSVPVSLSYSFVRTKRVDVYATGGAEVGKLVSGKRENDGSSTSVSEHRLQYSVNAAVGAAYDFGSGISAFVEPGVSHYFNNHSDVVNYYKDKPTNFSLNVGLRLSIGK